LSETFFYLLNIFDTQGEFGNFLIFNLRYLDNCLLEGKVYVIKLDDHETCVWNFHVLYTQVFIKVETLLQQHIPKTKSSKKIYTHMRAEREGEEREGKEKGEEKGCVHMHTHIVHDVGL